MQILLKSAQIIDPTSPFHGKKQDILINSGIIAKIDDHVDAQEAHVVNCDGAYMSLGWFDMNVHFEDPGNEHKEDLYSGIAAAAAGGFTDVGVLPNTSPTIDTKNQVEYILSKSSHHPVNLHPFCAITKNCNGAELTEMIDLKEAGAKAFTDGINPIQNTDILLKTLQYLQKFDGLLINRPEDKQLNMFGTMHEGIVSTTLGLKGMPSIAEVVMIQRDLKILEYTGGRIHFSNISTEESVKLIEQAKQKGLKVSCDVAAHSLIFGDSLMGEYDANYKVNPPFRLEQDRLALIEGLKNGVIDVIVSSHQPQDSESKELEFDLADFGAIGLQTVLPIIVELSSSVDLEYLIAKVTSAPRRLLGLENGSIKEGEQAVLTIFDTSKKWVFNSDTNFSKSKNSPLYGKELIGKVLGIVNGEMSYFL